ncbi:MAG: site-2 protease family protein [archaeon]
MLFYKGEVIHILISVLTISAAFSFPFMISFPVVFITLGLGFVLHELAHKIVAMRYGCVAVYRAWLEGLALALIFAIFTGGNFVFAAPGAVYIYKHAITRREDGIISLAGPLTNLMLAVMFLYLAPLLGKIAIIGFQVNAFLAFFNLLPIPPLDGSKVFSWNIGVWLFAIGFAAIMAFSYPLVF